VLHKPLKNKKQPMPKKAGVTNIGQIIDQVMNPIMDMMEITYKVIDIIDFILLPLRN
jgi:hypothetical protein